jgi:riboflavin kinase/FMN adenylyltransferase
MNVFRGFNHPGIAPACAITVGNFDGVHRGHQAMIALMRSEAEQRGVASCVLTFEPHPRDFFARQAARPELAPKRIATLRDKLADLHRCGVAQTVVLPFDRKLSSMSPQSFVQEVLVQGLHARYVLVGDDFKFGAQRAGDYAFLDAAAAALPEADQFDVARMNSYEVHGLRVSSSAVRLALAQGRMMDAARLLGHPYHISGHVVHGRKLGRELGFRTLNLRITHDNPAASGIFVARVLGLDAHPLAAVASLGRRPSLDPHDVNQGRMLLETHCLDWPAALDAEGAYGKIIRVELLHKLHDEITYGSMDALKQGITRDCEAARAFF